MNRTTAPHRARPLLVRAAHAWYAWAGPGADRGGGVSDSPRSRAHWPERGPPEQRRRSGELETVRNAVINRSPQDHLSPGRNPDDPFRAAPPPTRPPEPPTNPSSPSSVLVSPPYPSRVQLRPFRSSAATPICPDPLWRRRRRESGAERKRPPGSRRVCERQGRGPRQERGTRDAAESHDRARTAAEIAPTPVPIPPAVPGPTSRSAGPFGANTSGDRKPQGLASPPSPASDARVAQLHGPSGANLPPIPPPPPSVAAWSC